MKPEAKVPRLDVVLPPSADGSRHGFRSETQFARAFQARFGMPPSQMHAKVAAGDEDWLAAQAGRVGFRSLQAWREALAGGDPGRHQVTLHAGTM